MTGATNRSRGEGVAFGVFWHVPPCMDLGHTYAEGSSTANRSYAVPLGYSYL